MSVNPVSHAPPVRLRSDGLPVRICSKIFNAFSRSSYQSEYFVPSIAVAVDFE
jgi:hypothetical protein